MHSDSYRLFNISKYRIVHEFKKVFFDGTNFLACTLFFNKFKIIRNYYEFLLKITPVKKELTILQYQISLRV